MKTIAYSRILEGVAGLIGSSASGSAAIGSSEQTEISRHIERALEEVWNHAFWPWLVKVQQRYWQPVWSAGSYSAGDIRYYTPEKKYYIALTSTSSEPTDDNEWTEALTVYSGDTYVSGTSYAAGTTVYYAETDTFYHRFNGSGTEVPTNTTYWGPLAELERTVNLEQANEDEIGAVQSVHQDNPLTRNGRQEVAWIYGVNEIQVLENVPYVWLIFREPAPELKGAAYDASATYAADAQVLYTHSNGTSDFWNVLSSTSAGEDPEDTPAKFEKVEIPYAFKRVVENKAFAEYLLVRDREPGLAERTIANGQLEELVVRTWGQAGQSPQVRMKVRTR